MKPEEIRIAIAECCNVKPWIACWTVHHPTESALCMSADTQQQCAEWLLSLPLDSPHKTYVVKPLMAYPPYDSSLDAMHGALETLTDAELWRVDELLESWGELPAIRAKPISIAEAFLRVKGKWREG